MPSETTNFQCTACGGPLRFDSASGKLICDHCGSTFDPKQVDGEPKRVRKPKARRWSEEEAAELNTYTCSSCGAELVCGAETAATSCPYCGNPTVLGGRLADDLRPEYILPFKLDHKEAIRQLNAFYKGKLLLPRAFREKNHIEEIKGVYVPFWLYDASADVSGNYKGEISESHREGDYEVTVTEHYKVKRRGTIKFERVPADASTKMPDGHMDAIEPFDYSALEPFSTSYLPGFLADRYDQDKGQCAARAKERMRASAESALHDTLSEYTSYDATSEDVRIEVENAHYALLPVWMLHTKWNGKDFLFAMNGQTGHLVGELPIDKKRLAAWFIGVFAPVLALVMLFLQS